MALLFQIKRVNGVADDTVKAKTGKKWEEWYKLLDRAGAKMMDPGELVRFARQQFGLTAWWCQLLTVGYQQDRGLRQKHQRGSRFEVDRSKTVTAPLDAVWDAFHDPGTRGRWMPGAAFAIGKSTPRRILHLDWPDRTHAIVTFSEHAGRTKVVVSHERIASLEDARQVQNLWTAALRQLKEIVSPGGRAQKRDKLVCYEKDDAGRGRDFGAGGGSDSGPAEAVIE